MGSARRLKLYGYLLVLLMPCVAAAASIDPAVEESLRQQQRQIQLEQQRLQRKQREREQRRNAPPLELGSSEAPATTQGTAEGPCQNIQQIELAGASLIKKNQSDVYCPDSKPYEDASFSLESLNFSGSCRSFGAINLPDWLTVHLRYCLSDIGIDVLGSSSTRNCGHASYVHKNCWSLAQGVFGGK